MDRVKITENQLGHMGLPLSTERAERRLVTQHYRSDESKLVDELVKAATLSPDVLDQASKQAYQLVQTVRTQRTQRAGLDTFMNKYDLSSEEGVALLCLAEAMLRVPDKKTIDQLIQEKLTSGDWAGQSNKSDSLFVNAAVWGLMLTGKLYTHQESTQNQLLQTTKRILGRIGEPLVRAAVREGMTILGRQFVRGRTIEEALLRAKELEHTHYTFSYDMLGEAAITYEEADRYYQSYQAAIHIIGQKTEKQENPLMRPSISIKLSALHPRFIAAQQVVAVPVLIERLLYLSRLAAKYHIGLTLDAEESWRLDVSLDIFEAVFTDSSLAGWEGLGLAVQAYQKRAYFLLDWLIALAKRCNKRMNIRLVKGAYWDTEIKDSQVNGYDGYPVFTRKLSTDVSYIACAKKLIDAGSVIYPQFATHNVYSVSVILALMGERRDFEFQCLQGMGRGLYDSLVMDKDSDLICRIYSPVGSHQELLPYLVRRLLENGANTSFVNRLVDEKTQVSDLIADPVRKLLLLKHKPHPHIPLPTDLYGTDRKNSAGLNFADRSELQRLMEQMKPFSVESGHEWEAGVRSSPEAVGDTIYSPYCHQNCVGTAFPATHETIQLAISKATRAAFPWSQVSLEQRSVCLLQAADLLERDRAELIALIVREAGKTLPDALSEVREAVDFCRYYATYGQHVLKPMDMPGPTGESNTLSLHGRGVVACISPWNFPLAIFTGQVTAALMAGNSVIAKPAAQTPLVAAKAVSLLYEAGVPREVLHLLPGSGKTVGVALVEDTRINAVLFTGGTETARVINQQLAARPGPIVPFIAETGGQNAMIVDSTALPQQVITDVMISAFGSAGQRCSALRVLFLQEEIADHMISTLQGAMKTWQVGWPGDLATDVGPVIDRIAQEKLLAHCKALDNNPDVKLLYCMPLPEGVEHGTYVAPAAYEIPALSLLKEEHFGPILHVIRYARTELQDVIEAINASQYGLTLGIHTRLSSVAYSIQKSLRVGNTYINRNMVGAVVGVQPFGGEGLSGTGPKAGGPHYLTRLCTERTVTVNTAATGGNAALLALKE